MITTDELLKELKNADDINKFLSDYENEFISETPVSFLTQMIALKKTSIANVAKNSGIGNYVYKFFNNERNPSRNSLIAISFSIGLSVDETSLLLRIAKFAILDSRDKRDSIIIFGLTNNMSVFEIDDLLHKNNFLTIN